MDQDYLQRLAAATEELAQGVEAVLDNITRQMPGVDPFIVQDQNGRYILIDAYATLVHALVVLAEHQAKEQ